MLRKPEITQIDDYEKLVGSETIEQIRKKAKGLQHLHVVNVNSTYYAEGA
jgi:trehalose synthase